MPWELLECGKEQNLVNDGMNYLSTGAGFLTSTVGNPVENFQSSRCFHQMRSVG